MNAFEEWWIADTGVSGPPVDRKELARMAYEAGKLSAVTPATDATPATMVLKLYSRAGERVVELQGKTDQGELACELFHSADIQAAQSVYDNAMSILEYWYRAVMAASDAHNS